MPKVEASMAFGLSPAVFPVDAAQDPTDKLRLFPAKLPRSIYTLGSLGAVTRVAGPRCFPRVILRQPFEPAALTGIDARTVRVFRVERGACRPVWDSGINVGLGFVWSRISRPGRYLPLGLPRDRLLSEMLRALARARRYSEPQTPDEAVDLASRIFRPLLEAGEESEERKRIEELRRLLARLEISTSPGVFLPGEIRIGPGAVPQPFPLPGGISFEKLQDWLREWLAAEDAVLAGLPEEELCFPPERPADAEPPWLILPPRPLPRPVPSPIPGEPLPTPWPPSELGLPEPPLRVDERLFEFFPPFAHVATPEILCWLYSPDWWMHHRNAAHTGDARCSAIRRTNVGTLVQRCKIAFDSARIVSMPSVVGGKIYVGSSTRLGGSGGTLFKVDLETGHLDAQFIFEGEGDQRAHTGVGSSPAVARDRVYFSALTGKVYCLDAVSLACRWVTDLRRTDLPSQNQPVDHGIIPANGWSSPVVVNNRVYVACGEGESQVKSFGFVYCLDATDGKVIWLFCTNQFADCEDNKPNVIPKSSFDPTKYTLPAMFTHAAADPPQHGASPWSAPAYCEVLNRIYIGTGNAVPDDPLPDPPYASGLLSLDATTGDLKGFFQPCLADSYRPGDSDLDVPAGPMLFTCCGTRYVCFGSKNGSLFLLDAETLEVVKARRQLLPYRCGDPKKPFPNVDPPDNSDMRENKAGVFGTAALAAHLERIFVGLGGYRGSEEPLTAAIDHETTPFVRAVDQLTLADAWPMTAGDPPKYRAAQPPVYSTLGEAGMSSPAVVNDVVFVSTTLPALYAFDAETGLCLWKAPGIVPEPGSYALGPAIYGNYVVNGLSNGVLYIYSL